MLQTRLIRKAYFLARHHCEMAEDPKPHSHEYAVEAEVSGPVDASSGMILNLHDLDAMIKECLAPLTERYLNEEVEHFRKNNPTSENIAHYLFLALQDQIKKWPGVKLSRLRLYETPKIWAEVRDA